MLKKSQAIIHPLTDDEKERARRKLKRRVAAMLVRCMAEQDMSLEQIAERLGEKPDGTRKYLHDLIDGIGKELNSVSDLCLALDCEPEFSARLREQPNPAPAATETPSE